MTTFSSNRYVSTLFMYWIQNCPVFHIPINLAKLRFSEKAFTVAIYLFKVNNGNTYVNLQNFVKCVAFANWLKSIKYIALDKTLWQFSPLLLVFPFFTAVKEIAALQQTSRQHWTIKLLLHYRSFWSMRFSVLLRAVPSERVG